MTRYGAIMLAASALLLLTACGGGSKTTPDDDYFNGVAKALSGQQKETEKIFGDGSALLECNRAATVSLAAAKAACGSYMGQLDALGKSLGKLRETVARAAPPDRARDWQIRFLTFLDNSVFATVSAVDAFRKGDAAGIVKFGSRLESIPAEGDTLIAELGRLR